MNKFRPLRIRSQLQMAARSNTRELAGRGHALTPSADPSAGWWLARMILQSRELDVLITDLHREQCRVPVESLRPHWRPPSWLEESLPAGQTWDEYNALIAALTARRADLGRTYLPLMKALLTGRPVPAAVASIIVA